MKRRTDEAVRYLGYGKKTADERTRRMVDEAFLELEQAADPKSICRIFDIGRNSEDGIQIGNLTIISHSLARNLRGCDKAVLFCATLGAETDRLIRTGRGDGPADPQGFHNGYEPRGHPAGVRSRLS